MPECDEVVRLYGPWRTRAPADAADLFSGYAGRWWIAGGWAIGAFTGVSRQHGDLDPSIPRSDIDRLLEHLATRLDVWAADAEDCVPSSVRCRSPFQRHCGNLWLRPQRRGPVGIRRRPH